jgi:predicted ferric reductase
MNNKKEYSFPLIIIAVVLGWTIFKQFDFENLKFEKPAMAVVYILTFLMTVYFILKKDKDKEK